MRIKWILELLFSPWSNWP